MPPPEALAALHRALGGHAGDLAPVLQEWLLGGNPAPRDPAQFVFGGPGFPGTADWLRFMSLQHGLGIAPPPGSHPMPPPMPPGATMGPRG